MIADLSAESEVFFEDLSKIEFSTACGLMLQGAEEAARHHFTQSIRYRRRAFCERERRFSPQD